MHATGSAARTALNDDSSGTDEDRPLRGTPPGRSVRL